MLRLRGLRDIARARHHVFWQFVPSFAEWPLFGGGLTFCKLNGLQGLPLPPSPCHRGQSHAGGAAEALAVKCGSMACYCYDMVYSVSDTRRLNLMETHADHVHAEGPALGWQGQGESCSAKEGCPNALPDSSQFFQHACQTQCKTKQASRGAEA